MSARTLHRQPIAWAALAALHAGTVLAQPEPATPTLQTVTVTAASRSERAALDEPVRIDTLDAAALEAGQVTDLRDLERALPNVSVPRQPARFTLAGSATGRDGNSGMTVRGLGGNRLLMLVDGLRLPRGYSIGANAFGRDTVDFGLVERVELVRGPASALYGSDALAGVLAFTTRDPASYLRDGRSLGGQLGLHYSGDDRSWRTGATVAVRASEAFDWLLSAQVQHGHELRNQGEVHTADSTRTAANPQDDRGGALLFKGVWRPAAGHRTTLTLEAGERKSEHEVLSARTVQPSPLPTAVRSLSATERSSRQRASLDHRWQAGLPWADDLRLSLGLQDAETRQRSLEDRASAADRSRDARYRERALQAGLQAGKLLQHAGWQQQITYGADASRTRLSQFTTGVTPPAGERFPLKRFPDTTEQALALYAQDEIRAGRLTVTPGLRWDHYRLTPRRDDPLYAPEPAALKDSALSPKLALQWALSPAWRAYGHYATGFRAPSPYQLNEFFENPTQFYRSVPNPALRPEKSRGLELGVKAATPRARIEAALFSNRYRDFIDDRVRVGGSGTAADPLVFQSVNRQRARIYGFELKAEALLGAAWRLQAAYGRARGRDDDSGQPLNTVDPARLTLGAAYDAGPWQIGLDATHRAAKRRADIDDSAAPAGSTLLATGSSTVLDLSARWTLRPGLRLSGGVYNLTDRRVLAWADVRGLASNSPVSDAYTAPGRHLGVTLAWDL